ncbi:hypothetical protein Gotri_019045 [Gossypium trilobum]|uniref:Uncharacterized protein n=1 Tax=Gossypium trilobum TaxID=34281 RepID=A0A7J9EBX4_9ROSI|nr:hypothetical protein [Gossypium trilobum]
MGRSPCCDENGLKKGPWTLEEDQKLVKYIKENGHGSWRALPKLAGLNRCGKSCRLRWTNYLRPDIKRGKFSQEEEQTILNLHSVLGNKWSAIASHLPGRTDNEIKNFWNTHLRKKLIQMGIDPMTHRPRIDIFSSLPHLIALANLKELMDQQQPWEEAAQMAKLQCLQYLLQNPTSISSPSNNMHTTFTDMETMDISNSLLSSPPQLASVQGLDDSIPFSRLPDLQIPCDYRISSSSKDDTAQAQAQKHAMFSQGENTCNSTWLPSPSAVPSVTETLISNLGDASCSSNFDVAAPSVWLDDHQLFQDPLFQNLL